MARRGIPKDQMAAGTHIVSAVPCGLISAIITGDGTNNASLVLYDHAATATGNIKKTLTTLLAQGMVYTPSKPDAFSNGIVAVVAGTNALACVSIEPK